MVTPKPGLREIFKKRYLNLPESYPQRKERQVKDEEDLQHFDPVCWGSKVIRLG
jgi:hypothetical protein